jgi:hypothetical protein
MNSTYDYDPASRKDDLDDLVANVLNIIVPLLRPDVVTVIVGAFPWRESLICTLSFKISNFQVFHLPSWFPGMSFKMAVVREVSKWYLDRSFEYAL